MNPVLFWTLFAAGAWLLSRSWPAPEWMAYRRRVRPAFIVVLPLLLAYFFSPLAGIPRSAKYLSHLKPACAFAAAYPLIAAIGALVRRIVGRARDTARERSAVRERGLALAVAVLIPLTATAAHEQTLTVSDLTRVARILREQHGWDLASQLDRLKTPAATTVLAGLQQLADAGGRGPSAAAGSADAALVLVPSEDLPQPLPPNWTLVPRWGRTPAVLAFAASAIDWNTFHVCRQPSGAPEPQCWQSHWPRERATTGIFGLPNMPLPGPGARGTLALRLSAKGSVSGLVSEIYMPRLPDVCGGYIASPSGGALQVSSDRRRAILATSDLAKDDAPAIELEWHIGSPECDEWVYDGTVPFFLEGDAPRVQPLEAVLRRMEG
jgi:hypothetical protein